MNNLQIDNETQRNLFVDGGNFHWLSTSINEQAKMMFKLLILLTVGCPPNRSILCNKEFRGVPIKKLECFIAEGKEENKSDKEKYDPVEKYVRQLLQPDSNREEQDYEWVISQTKITAESDVQVTDIDNICASFKRFNIIEDPKCAVDIIKKVYNLYKRTEIEKLCNNEHFLKKTGVEIKEIHEIKRSKTADQIEQQRKAKSEVSSLRWSKQFVKENFVYTFSAVVNYHLGKRIECKVQTLIEALMGLGDVSEDQIILSDESDEFLYYISSLFLLTNMTSAPLATPPPRLTEILDLINGRGTRELNSKNIYSIPLLRISASKTSSKRRAYSAEEPSKKSRTVYLD